MDIPGLAARRARASDLPRLLELLADIGQWIIAHAVEIAKGRGCALIQLTSDKVRTAAHQFYARLGFVASHEGFKLIKGDPHGHALRPGADLQ